MSDLNPKGFANILTIDTIVPVMLATVLISLGWLITLPPWEGQMVLRKSGYIEMQPTNVSASDSATQKWLTVFTPVTSPERLAFIGAYFFSLQLLFRRFVRRDLRASAYVGVAQRVILAVIGIWVVVEAFQLFPEFGVGDQNRQEGQNEQTLERVL